MKFLIKPNARGGYRGSLLLTLYLISRVVDEKIKHPDWPIPSLLFPIHGGIVTTYAKWNAENKRRTTDFFFFTTLETVSPQSGSPRSLGRSLVSSGRTLATWIDRERASTRARTTHVSWGKSTPQRSPAWPRERRWRWAPERARRGRAEWSRSPARGPRANGCSRSATACWTGTQPGWNRRCCKPLRVARSWCRSPGPRWEISTAAARYWTLQRAPVKSD